MHYFHNQSSASPNPLWEFFPGPRWGIFVLMPTPVKYPAGAHKVGYASIKFHCHIYMGGFSSGLPSGIIYAYQVLGCRHATSGRHEKRSTYFGIWRQVAAMVGVDSRPTPLQCCYIFISRKRKKLTLPQCHCYAVIGGL